MLRNYKPEYLAKDIPAGIIVALVSIPISMGYAQVSGLPVVYGLYGSLLPILLFAFLSTSPQFVFGVDAAPSALVGGMIAELGITAGSEDAVRIVPVITLVTAVWLFLLFLLRAGRFTNYISTPVLGGFITGIGCEIILAQIPKLFGGHPGEGELMLLLGNIALQAYIAFNPLSLFLGVMTVVIIRVCAKKIPRIPMTVVMMFVGALITKLFHIENYGVQLLPAVPAGLPKLAVPDLSVLSGNYRSILGASFSVALVIVAETLLSTNSYAMKNNYKVKNGRELFTYFVCNTASAFSGCGPVSGSVSRTGIASQFGAKTQVMSIFAGITMGFVLLFGTGFIPYLPVPVLSGIVIAALMGILEFGLARKLKKADKAEWLIFYAAFWGVLLFGTINGVLIGVILSFVAVVIKAVVPPKAYLGCVPGRDGFYSLKRNRAAKPILETVVYRFSGTLFFANIGKFQTDIENAAAPGIKRIIVDAGGIGSIDMTAAERLLNIYDNLKSQGIHFYFTEHVGSVNDQLRAFGAERLISEGSVKRNLEDALTAEGLKQPYPLDETSGGGYKRHEVIDDKLAEFEWAFGEDADEKMKEFSLQLANEIAADKDYDSAKVRRFRDSLSKGYWDPLDDCDLLDYLTFELAELAKDRGENYDDVIAKIKSREAEITEQYLQANPDAEKRVAERHKRNEERLLGAGVGA